MMGGEEMKPFVRYVNVIEMVDRFKSQLQMNENSERLTLRIDRQKGHNVRNGISNNINDSMIGQLARNYQSTEFLRTAGNPFRVFYLGEAGIDCGGLSRDFMSELVQDITSERVGLFLMTPNARNRVGEFQDCIVPAPQSGDSLKHIYETIGALLAAITRTGYVQAFYFPPLFWKYLVDGQITINDVFEVDSQYKRLIDDLSCDMTSEEFDNRFNIMNTVKNIAGINVQLGIEQRRVTKSSVTRYISSANSLRLEELIKPLQWIRDGFWDSLGIQRPPYVSGALLEYMVCCEKKIDLQKLRSLTVFSSDISDREKSDLFWVLAQFDDNHRRKFLQFSTGVSSIPINPPNPFLKVNRSSNNSDMLPTAATCFFQLKLPIYPNRNIMYQRIMTAIEYSGSFEFS